MAAASMGMEQRLAGSKSEQRERERRVDDGEVQGGGAVLRRLRARVCGQGGAEARWWDGRLDAQCSVGREASAGFGAAARALLENTRFGFLTLSMYVTYYGMGLIFVLYLLEIV